MRAVTRKVSLPPLPATVDPAVRQHLEMLEGLHRSAALEGAVRWRDLLDIGVLKQAQGTSYPGYGPGITYVDPGSLDYSIPPAITGLDASGALANIILTWDQPTFSNYAYTEIYRAATDDFGVAVRIGQSVVSVYNDDIGDHAGYYYWVRAVSTADVTGPINDTAGTYGETGHDPDYVMQLLTSADWQASTVYQLFQVVDPSTPVIKGGKQLTFQCSTPGTSGTTEPTWSSVTGIGDTINDGSVTWVAVEAGTAPFVIGTVDGQSVVAISSAVIQDASIKTAKIGDLAVDTAKIADLAVSTAKIALAAVDTAQIANAAITTALIDNAAVTNAKIGNAAVDTAQIANAAIEYAKIGDAEVDTLKIAGNAVTIPVSAYTAGGVAIGTGTVLQSATITSEGGPINITAGVFISSAAVPTVTVYLTRNGTTIYTATMTGTGIIAFPLTSAPGTGSVTYQIRATVISGPATGSNRSLMLLEAKR